MAGLDGVVPVHGGARPVGLGSAVAAEPAGDGATADRTTRIAGITRGAGRRAAADAAVTTTAYAC
ncbi:hypothetical protein [Micromonospora deserti]|uniref:Uncharacterized protein n=1 Tax=Micromonospora deserti TaxID=2070366 RepID=A0A2W2D8U9_9ACTN|nr:hypothetical protein [Micromonospora deserti]PZG00289.1 hypothetical protein C1I99_09815 [Micromonospora deserti]